MDDVKSDADNDSRYRGNPQLASQFPVNYKSDLDDEDESNNSLDSQKANDDENSNNDESSFESLGKRRKLDNFEFVPRNPVARVISSSKSPLVKNSPPDWSEDSTFLLLEAWGDLFVKNGRKSLRSDEWSEVASRVNHNSKIIRSESQCRNRLDTLKKKYKKEKARMVESVNFKSDWIYFEKMDSLMPTVFSTPVEVKKNVTSNMNSGSPLRLSCGVDAGEYVTANSKVCRNQGNVMDEMRDNPGDTSSDDDEDDDDEDDGLPPPTNISRNSNNKVGAVSSLKILADSIKKFGEVYERIEGKKREQMLEIEKMRKEFCKDLEMQKRQILERAQAEIAMIRVDQGENEDDEDDKMVAEDNSDRMVDDNDDDDDKDDDDNDDDEDLDELDENVSG